MTKKLLLLITFSGLLWTLQAQNSPYVSRVLEYRPAPGQHINRLFPTPAMSDTPENALKYAESRLVGNKAMLGLGAFGGYVVVGFDHSIVNVKGEYDFKGLGNAFTGSSEPGIVMVCQDLNKNGKPDADEPWYELAGSEYNNPLTIKNYEITYYRPEGKKQDVRWTDNQGGEGSVKHISFATQDYMYPIWVAENTMTFKGTKLRNTAHDTSGGGTYWVLDAFDWGYVDNWANDDPIEKTGFKIDWAVDADGKPVDLAYIDFVKIYTAQVQEAGWLGETSTEVMGVTDLHPDAVLSGVSHAYAESAKIAVHNGILKIISLDNVTEISVINLQGVAVKTARNSSQINIQSLSSGIYLVKITDENGKQYLNKFINK